MANCFLQLAFFVAAPIFLALRRLEWVFKSWQFRLLLKSCLFLDASRWWFVGKTSCLQPETSYKKKPFDDESRQS